MRLLERLFEDERVALVLLGDDRRPPSFASNARDADLAQALRTVLEEIEPVRPVAESIPKAAHAPAFLRLPDVLAVIPVKKTAWWAGVKSGIYPAGVKIGGRVTAWRAEDIAALVERLRPG